MPFINYASREITCKLVYYGPGLGGKTTNLKWIYEKTNPQARGKMVSLATETERTLFFDLLPLSLGAIRGFNVRFQLYTVPGQIFYDASRKLIVKGADGVAMVFDSQEARYDANIESLRNLQQHLRENGLDFQAIPYVAQLNKRDLPSALPREELEKVLRVREEPVFEAVATEGIGVFETLKALVKQTLTRLRSGVPA
ncbi:MAG: GTPase domain-containing protein [Acidobacteria bacterium]|nr:GTPase domain-containing protein [Acidobacteriota bacterium]